MALGAPARVSSSASSLGNGMRMMPQQIPMTTASVIMAQPIGSHVGAYGGSFASPAARGSSVTSVALPTPSTPNSSRTSLTMPQSMLVPRLKSQNSSANLTVQPGTQVLTTQMPPPRSSTSSHLVEGLPGEEVLLRTRLVGSSADELVKAEAESLRRSVAAQEERILQLSNDLQASHENGRKLGMELEAARGEIARLAEELRCEQAAHQQAEANLLEARMVAEVAAHRVASQEKKVSASREKVAGGSNGRRTPLERPSPLRGTSASRKVIAERGTPSKVRDSSADERWPFTQATGSPSSDNQSTRRGSARPRSAKDEIDGRLYEFLERVDHDLAFRRLNRGWYSFRLKGDRGPSSNDRSVEISIVNGKLMARLEPSTHDPGWNNGKLGPIERFVAAMSQ